MKQPTQRGRERRALYPGSFDPVTRGHLDIVARAARLFDRLYIAVSENPGKTPLFDVKERLRLLEAEAAPHPNVEVVAFSGLTVELAARLRADWIVRGVRSAADAAYELPMAHSNRLCGKREVETLFIPASAGIAFVSSTLVREIAARGGQLSAFVTPSVEAALRRKFRA